MLSISKTGIRMNKNKLNLFLDLGLALIFIVEQEMNFTGRHNHELLGIILGAALVIHIVLHWDWVVSITKTFFKKVIHESRFNYLLNLLLFVDLFITVITGIMISRTLGLQLDFVNNSTIPWERIHVLASELSLLIVALHVAMHWKWIATHASKMLPSIKLPTLHRPQPVPPMVAIDQLQHSR